MTDGASLALGGRAAHLRRQLGPVAWSALEVLATHAVPDGDVLLARVGVRRLADEMGVATNTAARAARALVKLGLLVHSQRRAASGRFERGLYELMLPHDALAVVHHPRKDADAARGRKSKRLTVEQLALLPE